MTPRLSPLLRRLRIAVGRLARDTRGSMTVEAALVLPLWIWAYTMSFQYFDAFREQSVNLRAAYTISDMVSRETDTVGPTYINNLHDVFDYLTRASHPTWVRVSSVYYDTTAKVYKRYWSYSTSTDHPAHTDTTIQAEKARLPNMVLGETVVLVETGMLYEPVFNVGLANMWYTNFIPTRPRFASKVEYSASK